MKSLFSKSLLVIIVLFFTSKFYAQLTQPVNSDSVIFTPESKEISIDGLDNESYWSEYKSVEILYNSPFDFNDESDLSGEFKCFFNAYAFYFYGKVWDDTAHTYDGINGDSWTFDNIELFFNIDTSGVATGNTSYTPDGIQLRFNRGLDDSDGLPHFGFDSDPEKESGYNDPLLKYVQSDSGDYWTLEAEIPWKYILPSGAVPEDLFEYINSTIGFDVQLADSDGSDSLSGARDAQIAWDSDGGSGIEDNAWHDVLKFGLLDLMVNTPVEVTADAGKDVTLPNDTTDFDVKLSGKYSYGKDFSAISYTWYSLNNFELADSSTMEQIIKISGNNVNSNEYCFVLKVKDLFGNTDNDTVTISFINAKPIAVAGEDQIVKPETVVTLDGSQSYDPESAQLTYLWTSLDGIELLGNDKVNPAFIAPNINEDKDFRFVLVVSDGKIESVPDTITIHIDGFTNISDLKKQVVNIAPNPAKDYIFIDFGSENTGDLDYRISILSIDGKTLLNQNLDETTRIKLSNNFKPGLYLIKITNNKTNDTQVHKLIIE